MSGYGWDGHGDEGDNFIIVCEKESDTNITVNTRFYLKHKMTNSHVYVNKAYEFNNNNCRGCPIIG